MVNTILENEEIESRLSTLNSRQSLLAKYAFAGYDDSTTANVVYVFLEDADGAWVIRRINTSTGACDYATGSSGLAAAKADPAGQSYGDFSGKF